MNNRKNLDKKIKELEKAVVSLRANRDILLKELENVKSRTIVRQSV